MQKLFRNILGVLLFTPLLALAQGTPLNAYQTVDLPASPRQVWEAVNPSKDSLDGIRCSRKLC